MAITIMPVIMLVLTAYSDSLGSSRGSRSIIIRVSTWGWHITPSVGSMTQAKE